MGGQSPRTAPRSPPAADYCQNRLGHWRRLMGDSRRSTSTTPDVISKALVEPTRRRMPIGIFQFQIAEEPNGADSSHSSTAFRRRKAQAFGEGPLAAVSSPVAGSPLRG